MDSPRVGLFVTCLVDLIRPQVGFALRKVLVALFVRRATGSRDRGAQGRQLRIAGQHVGKLRQSLAGAGTIVVAELRLDACREQVPDLLHAVARDGVVGIARQHLAEQLRGAAVAFDAAVRERGPRLGDQDVDIGVVQHRPGQFVVQAVHLRTAAQQAARLLQGRTRLDVILPFECRPGTPEFRVALRDALENVKELPANAGVFNMTPTDHSGLDKRGRVIVKIQDGKWVLDKVDQ